MFGFDEINEMTGFANGNKFADDGEVEAYFTEENMEDMFSGDEVPEQSVLDEMAALVIKNRWHMA